MRIGIDISQIVHEGTGVGKYVREMVKKIISLDTSNEYILFGASLRKQEVLRAFHSSLPRKDQIHLKIFPIPPTALDILWNKLHIFPIEWFIGRVDVFWSSDWTQPPLSSCKGMTTVHDLTILRFPESFHRKIVDVQIRRMQRAKKECEIFLCDSESTKKDLIQFMNIHQSKIQVVYPGFQPSLE